MGRCAIPGKRDVVLERNIAMKRSARRTFMSKDAPARHFQGNFFEGS
jgi:hypothetical protein